MGTRRDPTATGRQPRENKKQTKVWAPRGRKSVCRPTLESRVTRRGRVFLSLSSFLFALRRFYIHSTRLSTGHGLWVYYLGDSQILAGQPLVYLPSHLSYLSPNTCRRLPSCPFVRLTHIVSSNTFPVRHIRAFGSPVSGGQARRQQCGHRQHVSPAMSLFFDRLHFGLVVVEGGGRRGRQRERERERDRRVSRFW